MIFCLGHQKSSTVFIVYAVLLCQQIIKLYNCTVIRQHLFCNCLIYSQDIQISKISFLKKILVKHGVHSGSLSISGLQSVDSCFCFSDVLLFIFQLERENYQNANSFLNFIGSFLWECLTSHCF